MLDHIRIATRESQLALWQAEYVKARLESTYPGIQVSLIGMTTRGDQILDQPLSKIGGKGLFIKELEQALLSGTADIAVHSMKDVPMMLPAGMCIAAICEREDPTDALVSSNYASVNSLPADARIGTSSLRRRYQLRNQLPSARYLELRGNVNTRLAKLDSGEYDAIILASAGLKRLNMSTRIAERLDIAASTPAAGQGAVGIECLEENQTLVDMLAALNDDSTAICVRAERSFSARLEASCTLPLAAFCVIEADRLVMKTYLADADGNQHLRLDGEGSIEMPEQLGSNIAEQLLAEGGDALLASHNI